MCSYFALEVVCGFFLLWLVFGISVLLFRLYAIFCLVFVHICWVYFGGVLFLGLRVAFIAI